MTTTKIDPTDPALIAAVNNLHSYELPHPMDRTGQLKGAMDVLKSQKRFVLVTAPVGSGKTSFAAWASKYCKTLALVEKKSLQAQYQEYGFSSLTGKKEYKCDNYYRRIHHPSSAETCLYDGDMLVCSEGCNLPRKPKQPKIGTQYCEHPKEKAAHQCKDNCEYPWAKAHFLSYPRSVTNYTKWLLDKSLRNYDAVINPAPKPDILFLDEAHKLGDILTDFKSVEITMPGWVDLPEIKQYVDDNGKIVYLDHWLNYKDCLAKLKEVHREECHLEPNEAEKITNPQKWVRWERNYNKIGEIIKQVEADEENVFFEVDDDKFIVKFLKPDMSYFDGIQKIVLMTATPNMVIEELGLNSDEVDITIDIPSNFTVEQRQVWVFDEAPKLGYKDFKDTTPKFELMAHQIISIFNEYPDWTGIGHFNAYYQCEATQYFLKNNGIDYTCVLPRIPTDQQMDWWNEQKANGKRVCFSPVWWEGVDLPDENINLICKLYFKNAYSKGTFAYAKRELNKKLHACKDARMLEQAVGRTQRGENSHYGPENSFIAILDGNWKRMEKYLSKDFLSRIKYYEEEGQG